MKLEDYKTQVAQTITPIGVNSLSTLIAGLQSQYITYITPTRQYESESPNGWKTVVSVLVCLMMLCWPNIMIFQHLNRSQLSSLEDRFFVPCRMALPVPLAVRQ